MIRDGKLYGRGGADDGYAAFSSLAAIVALKEQKIPLPRCVLLIEASEESGSIHLPAHLRALGNEIGEPSLVICLDAEAGNYDQVWCTTSLRGNLVGELNVRMLTEGVHSGMGTGISATPFRIAQQLIARLENPVTGDILVDELQVNVPPDRRVQIDVAAKVLGTRLPRSCLSPRGLSRCRMILLSSLSTRRGARRLRLPAQMDFLPLPMRATCCFLKSR